MLKEFLNDGIGRKRQRQEAKCFPCEVCRKRCAICECGLSLRVKKRLVFLRKEFMIVFRSLQRTEVECILRRVKRGDRSDRKEGAETSPQQMVDVNWKLVRKPPFCGSIKCQVPAFRHRSIGDTTKTSLPMDSQYLGEDETAVSTHTSVTVVSKNICKKKKKMAHFLSLDEFLLSFYPPMLNAMVQDYNLFAMNARACVRDAQSWNENEMEAAHARLLQVVTEAPPPPLAPLAPVQNQQEVARVSESEP